MTVQLNEQQAAGLEKVKAWYEKAGEGWGADVFRWFGYAGTGKTFTAARIPEALGLNNVVFGTYTGKAASVLRRSLAKYGVGFPVTTIHSAIYLPTTSKAAVDALKECQERIADLEEESEQDAESRAKYAAELEALQAKLPELEANAKRLRWEFNPEGDWAKADLIILDEVSMVNAKLAADIESYGKPVLVLGDPAQLPPVEGGGYYTNGKPDVLLTKIERQAIEGNPIVELATRIRESKDYSLGLRDSDMRPRSLREAMSADMVLVWTNKRRWAMINAMRRAMGRPADQPVPGDSIMNLTNNKDVAVFNGQIFTVLESQPAADPRMGWDLKVEDEDGNVRDMAVYAQGFQGQEEQTKAKNTGLGMTKGRLLATFAQAITVHKAQGSEAETVYVVNETPGMIAMATKRGSRADALAQANAWLYTAVTRARGKVVITQP